MLEVVIVVVWVVALAPRGLSPQRGMRGLNVSRLRRRLISAMPRRVGRTSLSDDDAQDVRVVLAQVVALVRAGATPAGAWTRATGVPVDEAGVPCAQSLASILGEDAARACTAATRLALTVGAPLGRVLNSVADSLVASAEAESERRAALAGPQTTARVLRWMPVAGAALGAALGADPVGVALGGGVGSIAVGLGLVLMVTGRWWTRLLVGAALKAGEP
ncbi:MAG: hypothetical protein LBH13_04925 [Cellulomonadaceae bacterium]|jgi:tight adherence protein B|nr:hypothetical protein [Cellulomonadaceae bacterium]